jgi:hypothetical protein
MQPPQISTYPYYLPSYYSNMNSNVVDYESIGQSDPRLYNSRYLQPITYDVAKIKNTYEIEIPDYSLGERAFGKYSMAEPATQYGKLSQKNGSGLSMNHIFLLVLCIGILYVLYRKAF